MFGSLSFLLAANDVVKAFVWSPHVQMLNIFVPAFALWAAVRASEKALFERRFALLVGAITGLGATAYPLFVIVLPCVFAAGVAALIRQWSRSALRALAVNFALLAALTLLPEALWYVFVTYRTGGFYQHELAGGQVLWMSAAWQQGLGALLAAWTHKFTSLVELAARQAIPIAALVAIIAVAMTRAWTEAARIARRQLPLLLCSAMVSLVTAAFYSSTGLITWRLAYAMLPPLIIAAGAMTLAVAAALAKHEQRMLAFACATVALLQAIFTIVKNGPYS
jgi:4-amino-4-deoxy-L-arabinose transferase-like glycosyltransferase